MATVDSGSKVVDVAVGVMLRPDGSLLLGQRPEGKPYAGWWELPGGKLEPGETVLQALARELKEELGVTVLESATWVTHVHAYSHATVRLYFCRVTRWEGQPHGLESQALQWARIRAATPAEIAAAAQDRERRIAALQARLARGEQPTDLEAAQARAQAPEDALGLALEPRIGPLLPATLPPLQWLHVPDTYAITNIGSHGNVEPFLKRLDTALTAGVKLIQFREPGWPGGPDDPALRDVLRQVVARARATGAQVLLNSIHPAAWRGEADGVHLRSADIPAQRPDLPRGARLGVSAHSAEELERARRLDADFAVLAPVLPTASHPGQPGMGWEAFAAMALHAGLPVFALGGQSSLTRATAVAHGAHGIAGIGAFWGD